MQGYDFNFKFNLETIMPDNLSKKLETIYKLSDILKQIVYLHNVHIKSHSIDINDTGVTIYCENAITLTFKLLKNDAVEYHFKQDQIIDEPIDIVLNKHQHIVIEPTNPSQQLKRTIHETYHIDYVGDLAYTIDPKFKTRYNKDL